MKHLLTLPLSSRHMQLILCVLSLCLSCSDSSDDSSVENNDEPDTAACDCSIDPTCSDDCITQPDECPSLCQPFDCGVVNDSSDGTCNCGSCNAPLECQNNMCIDVSCPDPSTHEIEVTFSAEDAFSTSSNWGTGTYASNVDIGVSRAFNADTPNLYTVGPLGQGTPDVTYTSTGYCDLNISVTLSASDGSSNCSASYQIQRTGIDALSIDIPAPDLSKATCYDMPYPGQEP